MGVGALEDSSQALAWLRTIVKQPNEIPDDIAYIDCNGCGQWVGGIMQLLGSTEVPDRAAFRKTLFIQNSISNEECDDSIVQIDAIHHEHIAAIARHTNVGKAPKVPKCPDGISLHSFWPVITEWVVRFAEIQRRSPLRSIGLCRHR